MKTYEPVDCTTEDFQMLHEIYKAFTSVSSRSVSDQDTRQVTEIDPVIPEEVSQDDLIQISDLVDLDLCPTKSNPITDQDFQDISTELANKNYECHQLRPDCLEQHPQVTLCNNNSVIQQLSQGFQPSIPTVSTPVKGNVTIASLLHEQEIEQISNNTSLQEKSPAFKIISNSQFAPFLTMPKTPERKGKRNTVRFPYAITSDKYRAMFSEQKEKKESALKMKEERKRVREEMKTKKENVNPCKKKIKETTNACKICSKPTKTSNRLCCDICSSIFHVKCVPNKHQQHVPEDITIDLYLCHVCYSEENDDDDNISLERTDEENNNTAEDIDAQMLFEMYQKNKYENS